MVITEEEPKTELVASPLLPEGFFVPSSRFIHPSIRMRQLLDSEPYLFGPGVYDPFGAQLAMYYGFKAVYFSGYSFAIGHLALRIWTCIRAWRFPTPLDALSVLCGNSS